MTAKLADISNRSRTSADVRRAIRILGARQQTSADILSAVFKTAGSFEIPGPVGPRARPLYVRLASEDASSPYSNAGDKR
jgi:hypothetical protein